MDNVAIARKLFKNSVQNINDEDLVDEITKFELLSEHLLDLAEKKLFEGKVLSELISDVFTQEYSFNLPDNQQYETT